MLVNLELKHLHVHVPKTGGTSISREMESIGEWNTLRNADYRPILNLGAHATLPSFARDPEILKIVKPFYKSTMIRNPWEHAVSFYRYALHKPHFIRVNYFGHPSWNTLSYEEMISKDLSFERFINKHYMSQGQQSIHCREVPGVLEFDEWFDYTNYQQMISSFESRFNVKINGNRREVDKASLQYVIDIDIFKPYQSLYNDTTYNIIADCSKAEIARFDYKF